MYSFRIIIFVFFISLINPVNLFGTGEPQEARERYPYAVIDVSLVDFGKVERGSTISGKVGITNEGALDLMIAKARSSCGLLIQTWPDFAIKTGETVFIHYRFDNQRLGLFERLITIHTNAWQKDLIVKVRGEVIPPPNIQAIP